MGILAVWKLIKNCLEDENCQAVVRTSQVTLESVQDSMSETERSERMGARKKQKGKQKEKKDPPVKEEKADKRTAETIIKPAAEPDTVPKPIYPPLEEFYAEHPSTDGESEGSDSDTLDPSNLADLEDEAARYEAEKYHPDENRKILRRPPSVKAPSAPPPPYAPKRAEKEPVPKRAHGAFLLPEKVRRQLGQLSLAFPVFEGDNGGRIHAPVDFNQLKELAESVRKYGPNANFTLVQLDRLATHALTPADWQTIVQAALPTMGQYMEWKALWQEAAQAQARANANALTPEQRNWTTDMLTGQGAHAADQNNYHWGVYPQIAAAAIKAWKALSKTGEANTQLSKIIQGPQESFSDYVARMTEAANRIFGDVGPIEPFIQQLIFEQATQECRAAIAPRKSKGLQDWLRVCRELGGPLTNAGLAAAILQSQRRSSRDQKVCFKCGKPGHFRRQCTEQTQAHTRPLASLCARCGKGYHKVSMCRSVRDIKGQLLPPLGNPSTDQAKNGM